MAKQFLTEILRSVGKGRVEINGRFYPNGSSAIDNTKNVGVGWSVEHTSTGLYTITFHKVYPQLVSFVTTLQLDTPAGAHDLVPGDYVPAAKTITISHFSAGSLGDLSAAEFTWVHFMACFKNTLAPG
jgi:hypothetical protein